MATSLEYMFGFLWWLLGQPLHSLSRISPIKLASNKHMYKLSWFVTEGLSRPRICLMVFGKSQKDFTFRARFSLFFFPTFLPPFLFSSILPFLPSFLKSLFVFSFLQTKKFKVPVARVTSRKPSRRGSALSLSRTSGASSPQSSMVSVNPGSDEPQSVITQATGSKDVEDNESSSAKPEEEPLHVSKSYLRSDQSALTLSWNQISRAPRAPPSPHSGKGDTWVP